MSAPSLAPGRALSTAHGPLALPAFLPDATRAVVRGLDSADLLATGVQGLVVNVFHLQSHPGVTVVAGAGGVHGFMGWPRPVLSDSGGFQVFSLLAQSPGLGSVTKRGFTYRAAHGADKTVLTPEKCIQQQFRLGSDVMVCLDHCTHPAAPAREQRQSVEHTVLWAGLCKAQFERLCGQTDRRPLLFAVIQGGNDAGLRRECAERLLEMGFDGYGFGGWPIDKDGCLTEMVQHVAELVPTRSPKWALGIGKPEHVVAAARMGYGLFDCVIPTRDARHGRLYAFAGRPGRVRLEGSAFYDCLYMLDRKHIRDRAPVDATCDCLCCRTYSRAYLHHLFRIRDAAAQRLATIHNLRTYARLMELLRAGGSDGA
jgi:queuine tRNA-ribosyltransferase